MIERMLNDSIELHCGDCLDVLKTLPDNSVDSCVTDPPYHLTNNVGSRSPNPGQYTPIGKPKEPRGGFMGKQWDGGDIAFRPEVWAQVLRVLKPGGYLLSFGGTRTYHRMACAIEDAGFEIRDCIQWLYGQGFPKSHNAAVGVAKIFDPDWQTGKPYPDAARQWEGWGTALKPANEPICLARKPLSEGTVAANVLKWGTGAINVAACRVGANGGDSSDNDAGNIDDNNRSHIGGQSKHSPRTERQPSSDLLHDDHVSHRANGALNGQSDHGLLDSQGDYPPDHHSSDGQSHLDVNRGEGIPARSGDADKSRRHDNVPEYNLDCPSNSYPTLNIDAPKNKGRWPANLIHDGSEEVAAGFPETTSGTFSGHRNEPKTNGVYGAFDLQDERGHVGDSGSAARFFYTSKADSDDRLGSRHPTVKPLDLMQYLVRLVTPKGGAVFDPFAGTGTTGEAAWREGMRAVLIEREAEYQADIRRRMKLAMSGPDERAREAIKERTKDKPIDHGPLFTTGV